MYMLKRFVYLFPIVFCSLHGSCDQKSKHRKGNAKNTSYILPGQIISKKAITNDILLFEDTPPEIINSLSDTLSQICSNVFVKSILAFPKNSFYKPRQRFQADSLICYHSSIIPANHVSIGITIKDINTKKVDMHVIL